MPGLASSVPVQSAVCTAGVHAPPLHATAGQLFVHGSHDGFRQYVPSGAHAFPPAARVSMSRTPGQPVLDGIGASGAPPSTADELTAPPQPIRARAIATPRATLRWHR